MHPTLWQDVLEIWPQISQCPPDQWDRALQEACGDRQGLAIELRSLLESEHRRSTFLGLPLLCLQLADCGIDGVSENDQGDLGDTDDGTENAVWIGRRLGAFEIQQVLEQGGMEGVFLARRVDGEVAQDVALKVVRSLLWGTGIDAKSRSERQTQPSLQHPYIARLVDVGSDENGCSFAVMEYVPGVPINAYCAQHPLGITERVCLMVKVCQAVQAAHGQDLVHRDLKPTNILVTEDGVPKLLNFGLAKRLALSDLEPTNCPMMTLGYASPEQLAGQSVHAASDVFSLGVLLYELMTGVLPYGDGACGILELQQRMFAGPPHRPSDRVCNAVEPSTGRPRRWNPLSFLERTVLRDLDRVVLKALEVEAGRRYPDAEALALDLQRVLEGRPVEARPSGWTHRFGKLVLRHHAAAV